MWNLGKAENDRRQLLLRCRDVPAVVSTHFNGDVPLFALPQGRGEHDRLQGKEQVALYQPAPPYKYGRCFCRICGTSLGEILSDDDSFPIAANALDTETGLRNQFHEFVAEKPGWYETVQCDPQAAD
jgi:hypothetical protein